mmetsp:Transcript_44773/g.133738  ORF Transcript_44773/g.133738 Transcript_44773/m.133738 type:complete len:145 (-) Transcript_44773:229-663(-)
MSMLSQDLNPVARNSVWEEHVKKENKTIKLGSTFHITDPRKLSIYPDKPNCTKLNATETPDDMLHATRTLAAMSCLKDTDRPPSERFALPVTSNMDYGFFSACPLNTNAMFMHGTKKADVTDYAQEYVKMAGCGPYNNKDSMKA